MITKEEFIKLINDHRKWERRLDEVEDVLNIFPYEVDWINYGEDLFATTINLLFKEEGVDDIGWWLWEKNDNPDLRMWDENDNEIPTETVEDLWEIVKDYRK